MEEILHSPQAAKEKGGRKGKDGGGEKGGKNRFASQLLDREKWGGGERKGKKKKV